MSTGRIAIYALTAPAAERARVLAEAWPSARLLLPARLARPQDGERGFGKLADGLAENFGRFDGHVIFAAAGLVVRALAGLLKKKDSDPAVVVVDQEGRWAVSLLSGHLGGANHLAHQVAGVLHGQAVITTATDSLGLPSLEVVAREQALRLPNLIPLAAVSRMLVEGEPVPVFDPGGWLWPALAARAEHFVLLDRPPYPGRDGPLVLVDWRTGESSASWLVMRPPCLAVGLGCNRGTSADEMEDLLKAAFTKHSLAIDSLAVLASIDLKADEPGMLELARRLDTKIIYYPADRLRQAPAPNPSPLVEREVGTASVCEAAAMLAAKTSDLLVSKTKSRNATLAVAPRSRDYYI